MTLYTARMYHTNPSSKSDLRHLGVLIGSPVARRIIAVSTSMVFHDSSLLQTFWGIEQTTIDSGFQGHIYTRQNDVLIVQVPGNDDTIPNMVASSINVNYRIWKSLTGIELSSADNYIVIVSGHAPKSYANLPANITWYKGSLPDAAISRYLSNDEALLAFVLDERFRTLPEKNQPGWIFPEEQARTASLLMDKNYALHLFGVNQIPCAKTYFFNKKINTNEVLSLIPYSHKYVFKPAGGAAGIGVFGKDGLKGPDEISRHVENLKQSNKLPRRFQIQEFLGGVVYGCTAWINEDRRFEIFEIHQQYINDAGRFTGGRWTQEIENEQIENIVGLYNQLAAIKKPRVIGLVCLDIIDGKIIEINPRLTASAPIAHMLQKQDELSAIYGKDYHIKQIDLNTNIQVPYEYVIGGKLEQVIHKIYKESKVLILPQGLNPFGGSRFIFINDNEEGSWQQEFIRTINS